ncbi:ankyrin, partial [Trichocladium antarcticum]
TPLSQAAKDGHETIVRLLLDHGASLEARNVYGATPMWYAMSQGHLPVIQLLHENGADINSRDEAGMSGLSALVNRRYLVRYATVRQVLDMGVDIESKNNDTGYTLLMCAVQFNNRALVQLLLDYGANVHAKTRCGRTALMISYRLRAGPEMMVKVLLEAGANV